MRILTTHIHPDIKTLENQKIFKRLATRAITLQGSKVLALHTKRYDDYSLPGGGLDQNEDKVLGMKRELTEETGAQNISNIKPFGVYEEFRPWHKPEFDIQHMISYCYTCSIDKEFGATQYESYEIRNGMKPVWIELKDAIKHNQKIIKHSQKKGLSVERETFLFSIILKELVGT